MDLEHLRVIFSHFPKNLAKEEEEKNASSYSPPGGNRDDQNEAKHEGYPDRGGFTAHNKVGPVGTLMKGRAIQRSDVHK